MDTAYHPQWPSKWATNVCVCVLRCEIHLIWPPAAAWVWGHFWNPLQCSRSVSRPSSNGSYTKLWRSERGRTEEVTHLSPVWQTLSQTLTASTTTTQTYTHTQLDVSLLRAGSKLLSKAWTVHFSLWPCYYCGCWRWERTQTLWDTDVTLTATVDSTVLKQVETSGLYYYLVRKSLYAWGNH